LLENENLEGSISRSENREKKGKEGKGKDELRALLKAVKPLRGRKKKF